MPDSRMRVLGTVTDLEIGGGENRILNIARSIDRSRFEYSVATLYSPVAEREREFGSMHEAFSDAGVRVIDLGLPRPRPWSSSRPLQLMYTASRLTLAITRLRRFLVEAQIDLVDAHLDHTLFLCVPAARAARVPVAVTLYTHKVREAAVVRRVTRRLGLRGADAIFTDSATCAGVISTQIGGPRPPTWIVPNGVRLSAPERSRAEVLAALRLPDSARRIVGQISRCIPSKGHRTLLRAAARVLEQQPGTYFLVIGFPEVGRDYVESLEEEARSLGISEWVRIEPYPGNIADVWQIIDVHAHASELDSLPNAIIEGMSLGKPAVVTAVGDVPEQVEHEQTGLVVPPADPVALADALLRVLRDPALGNRLGAAARRRYLERYTPEVTVRQLERYFREMHDGYHRGRRRAAIPQPANV